MKFLFSAVIFLSFHGFAQKGKNDIALWKKDLVSTGDYNAACRNAILDFLHSGNVAAKDSLFSLYCVKINDKIIGVSIFPERNNIAVVNDGKGNFSYKSFPTNYVEQEGKIFFWTDSSRVTPSKYLVQKLYNLNRVDTAMVNEYFPPRLIDDALKSIHYYFCSSDLRKYKKNYTSIAMGWYKVPKIPCP